MTDRTAISLQYEGPLDLVELATACDQVGLSFASRRTFAEADVEWNGIDEDGAAAFAFRDVVRRALPGSYCIPITKHQIETYGPLRVRFADAYGLFPTNPLETDDDRRWRALPRWVPGTTETECWARALVALYRARLLLGGEA